MFGYIKPLTPELKVKEYELYKAFYCGLCKTMGKKISLCSRITLSYDMVFLCLIRTAAVREAEKKECVKILPFRCKLKPLKKRAYVQDIQGYANNKYTGSSMLYSSCVSAILIYYKCIDDINDTKNKFKKFAKMIYLPYLSRMKKKACTYYQGLEDKIKQPLIKLAALEKEINSSVDAAAACSAELMQNIAVFGIEDKNLTLIMKIIGWHLGRWLYIVDAADDFEKNIKDGEYNPFVEYYKTKENMINDIDLIRSSLTASLAEMNKAFSLAGNSDVSPIIINIINLGLCEVQEKVLGKFDLKSGNPQ